MKTFIQKTLVVVTALMLFGAVGGAYIYQILPKCAYDTGQVWCK